MSKTSLTSLPRMSTPLISRISSPSCRRPLCSAAPPFTMRLMTTLSISFLTVAPCINTHVHIRLNNRSNVKKCIIFWGKAMKECPHQWDVLRFLNPHDFDSLPAPLGESLTLIDRRNKRLQLHLLFSYTVMGHHKCLEDIESQRWWVIFRTKATEFYRVDMSLISTSCYRVQKSSDSETGIVITAVDIYETWGVGGCVRMWCKQTCMWGVLNRVLSSSPSFCELLCIMTSTCEDRFNNRSL